MSVNIRQSVRQKKQPIFPVWKFEFCAVRDFSCIAEGFDRSINWVELDRVDFSSAGFYNVYNNESQSVFLIEEK